MEPWQFTPWTEVDLIIRLLLATLAGAVIGYEREQANKPAGLRTNTLVCLGSALFTVMSAYAFPGGDPSRVAAGIVIGIGFLGAGTIMREDGKITGLTTAATIWVVAAIGVTIGAGFFLLGLITAGIVFLVLHFLYFRGNR